MMLSLYTTVEGCFKAVEMSAFCNKMALTSDYIDNVHVVMYIYTCNNCYYFSPL